MPLLSEASNLLVSITIASFNSCEVTRKALHSIFDHTKECPFEIIVVDNGSTDGSVTMIAECFPTVRLIQSPKNIGFAAAHNLAMAASKGNLILCLNSDILFTNDVISSMIKSILAFGPTCGSVGPQIINADGTIVASSRTKIIYPLSRVLLSVLNQYVKADILLLTILNRAPLPKRLRAIFHDKIVTPTEPQFVEWVDGMCVLFRRMMLQQIGLFDERYFFDFEIGDLLIRGLNAGWKVGFDPTIQVTHLGGYSRSKFSSLLLENRRSQLTYFSKHSPSYVEPIKKLHYVLLTLEVLSLKIQSLFDKEKVPSINLVNRARKMLRTFELDGDSKIPALQD